MSLASTVLLNPTISSFAIMPLHGGSAPLVDFGQFLLWALPVAKFLFNVSAAATIGALVLACIALTPNHREYARALNSAGISAAVWTVISAVTMMLAYLDAADGVASDDLFGAEFALFVTSVGLGQTWLVTTVIAAIVTMLCFAVRNAVPVGAVTLLAIGGLVPLTLNGHPNYGEGHEAGMAAFGLHIIAAALWLGGLITLVVLRPVLTPGRLTVIVRRYSALALFSFIVLAASGYLRAQVTIGTLENLSSAFGLLVLVKAFALVVLGVLGFAQRRWIISRMERDPADSMKPFWTFVTAELLFMGLASGIAPILAQIESPIPDVPVAYSTLAERMVDAPLPPAPGPWNYFTEFGFDPIWFLLFSSGVLFYLAGVRRLHRAGGRWPARRSVYWLTGLMMLLYITNGGLNVYREFLLSAQVLAQVILTTIIPVLLAAGHPVILASRTISVRDDGSWGPREWIKAASRSPLAGALAHPYAGAAVLSASLVIFYYSPLLQWAARDPLGHQWMMAHFLAVGVLFVNSLRRSASGPGSRPPNALYAVLAATMFYIALGLFLLSSPNLLLPEWYGAMESPWAMSAMTDQRLAGAYMLSIDVIQGSLLTLVLLRRGGLESRPPETPTIAVTSRNR
ncbi:cytochrome c oxidase assembly protein [Arthrobacter roseus]|uniref:cytochrome c oxidase assembly protein n=1 Tax=Arthrobacter roseus TaxID=136274 RepID=UPI001965831E|nr:cytochrome c oxidase assembly protein [Arthrobacter roseus]MBM7846798.1 putative copper resistance protein D [Arthrobacter roseus]